MTDSPSSYPHHIIPSVEEQAHHSDIHEGEVDGEDFPSASTRIVAEVRTKWTYFLLGCAILLPWDVVLNGTSFFLSRLADSSYFPKFGSYMASMFTLTKVVGQFCSTFTSEQSSSSRRIFASTGAIIILVVSLWISTFIRGTPSTFFGFFLFIAASLGVAAAYLLTAVYAKAALLGPFFMRTVLSGNALMSVVASSVNVISSLISLWGLPPPSVSKKVMRAIGKDDSYQAEEVAARIFFGIVILFCGVVLVAFARLPVTKERRRQTEGTDEGTRLLDDGHSDSMTGGVSHVYQVLKRNWIYMFPITYCFAVTAAIFPAVTIRVKPMNPEFHPMLFNALHIFTFYFGDLIGRICCTSTQLAFWSAKGILIMSLLRTLFIPVLLACNIPRPTTTFVSPIIYSDVIFMLIILAFGLMQGYTLSLGTVSVSSLKHNPNLKGRHEDVEVAATLSGTCLVVGLVVGSTFSFAVQAMI